jgi:hypothetical protein
MINEVPAYPVHLTEKQEHEALAAAYGAPMSPEMTYEERVRMRRILDDLDRKEAGGSKEFDLNKPPVPPYVYREYPFLMYNHGKVAGPDAWKMVKPALNHEQREKMRSEGWSEEPRPIEIPGVELTASERLQADEIDRRLRMPRERLEAEQSAEYMASMRAQIEELEAKLAVQSGEEPKAEPSELETIQQSRKRSKA